MDNQGNLYLNELPFRELNDFQVEQLFTTAKQDILTRMNNPVLLNYLKNKNSVNLNSLHVIDCMYFTEDGFNHKVKTYDSSISSFHLNIRKLGRHRDELIAFLSILDWTFDVIILTEVGKNSESFIKNTFHNHGYIPFHDFRA